MIRKVEFEHSWLIQEVQFSRKRFLLPSVQFLIYEETFLHIFAHMAYFRHGVFVHSVKEQTNLIFASLIDHWPQTIPHLSAFKSCFLFFVSLLSCYRTVKAKPALIFRGITAICLWRINAGIVSPCIIDAPLEAFPRIADVQCADNHLIVGVYEP